MNIKKKFLHAFIYMHGKKEKASMNNNYIYTYMLLEYTINFADKYFSENQVLNIIIFKK